MFCSYKLNLFLIRKREKERQGRRKENTARRSCAHEKGLTKMNSKERAELRNQALDNFV